MSDKEHTPEVKVSRYGKVSDVPVPERIWIDLQERKHWFTEEEALPEEGDVEYIRRDLVYNGIDIYEAALRKSKKKEQALQDKIKNIFRWCDGKFRLIKKLEKRIHRQRLALRKNWEIVRMQQAYRKTPLKTMWFDKSIALGKENNALRNKISELEHQNAGLRQKIRNKFTWDNIE